MQPQFVAAFESTSNSLANDSDNQCHLQTYVHVITIDITILNSYSPTDASCIPAVNYIIMCLIDLLISLISKLRSLIISFIIFFSTCNCARLVAKILTATSNCKNI